MPTIGEGDPLAEVMDEPVPERAPALVAEQRPLVGRFLVAERVGVREDAAELMAEEALAREP